jgi:hypothetical protein
MARIPLRHIRVDGWWQSALDAMTYDRHSTAAAELIAAIDHRLTLWRSGELPWIADEKRGAPADCDLYPRIDAGRWDALGKLAAERGTNVSREIVAAIDERLALWRAGRLTMPEPPADPGPIVVPDARPWSSPDALEDVREIEQAGHGRTSRRDCPHPRSRIHKGLCHACGSPV